MVALRFTRASEQDLVHIERYSVAKFGRRSAEQYLAGLQETLMQLVQQPAAGRSVEEVGPGIRRFRYRRHYILYRFTTTEGIVVSRIMHTASQLLLHSYPAE